MFRVVVTLIKHYALSEKDALALIKKGFNDRCRDAKGASYPYGDRQLVHMIQDARMATFDPIGHANASGFELNTDKMHANHRRRDQRPNRKRKMSRAETRTQEAELVYQFLSIRCFQTPDKMVRILQGDLYDACVAWVWNQYGVKISRMKIGGVLDCHGVESERVGHANTIYRLGIGIAQQVAA